MGARRTAMWAAAMVGLSAAAGVSRVQPTPPRLQLVIVVDGLRPDMVTARQMPRLDRIAARGVEFTAHHAVFPTVTRVNAATFVTGVLPARHGLLGNTIYIPSVNPVKTIDTADHEALLGVAARDRSLLAAPTLGQILARAGKRLLVVSSGSPGSALLLSPTPDAGVILQTEFARPDEWRAKSVAMLGPTPAAGLPNAARNRYATDLLLRIGLPEVRPDVVFDVVQRPRHHGARPRPRRSSDPRVAAARRQRDRTDRGLAPRPGPARDDQPRGHLGPRLFRPYGRIRPARDWSDRSSARCPTARPTSWWRAARCTCAERRTRRA